MTTSDAFVYFFGNVEKENIIGRDFSPVGLKANLPAITKLLTLCDEQGYVSRGRPFTVEEFFHPDTLDT